MALALQSALGGADMGTIMARFVRPRFVVASMIAAAIIASTTGSGWAFTQQMLSTGENGNYNFNYSDPDHQATTSQSTSPFNSNSPGLQLKIGRASCRE